MRGRSERIISFKLDHRPDDNAHRRERNRFLSIDSL
jgi:hypothetical protein